MKVLSTDGLTKLIELIKNGFISVDNTVTTSTTTLATVATSGSYNDLTNKPTIPAAQVNSDWNATSGKAQILNKPTIPSVGNAEIEIQKNGTKVDSFTTNQSGNKKTINITVPTTASDVNALPSSTKYGATIDVTLSTTDYKQTITLKDQDGNTLNSKTVDFPVESMVVSGTFDSTNKKIILTLQNGNTTDIPVGDLISGLQTEITSSNKLSADLIADGTTNKVVTASEKTTWNGKQNAISDLATIRTNASNGNSAYTTIQGYGDIVTHDADEFLTEHQDLSGYQAKITSSNKLSADLLSEGTTNKLVSATEKSTWNGKQNAITSSNKLSADLLSEGTTNKLVSASEKTTWSGKQDALTTTQINNIAKGGTALQPNDNVSELNNDAGYITGIDSNDVTTALGYTPYNSTNPNGYTSNVGTVTSVNNTQPDASGNVELVIPDALPSQTGNAGKFLTTDGTDASWGIPTSRNIGEIVQSSLPLIDAGLHLLDGALLSGDGIYGDFVDYIANNYTVLSTAFTSESAWQSSVTNYGSCGKFVYDSTNNTVRLPKVSDILQGTTDVNALGDLVEAGLPNIEGTAQTAPGRGGYTMTGAMYQYVTSNATNVYARGSESTETQYGIGFDASRSSSIYGNSSTVQPQTIKVLTYIVVATSAKTDIQVDIDQIATDLNQKQDINTCVLKTGDTMSGALRVGAGSKYLDVKNDSIEFYNPNYPDASGLIITNNSGGNFFYGTRISSGWGAGMTINLNDNTIRLAGVDKFTFPKCTTKATTTSSAADNKVAVIVKNYVNGASWYRVWSDGWIEQGGRWDVNNVQDPTTTINLAKSFSNTNYTITLGAYQTAHDGSQESVYSEPSTTNFKLHVYGYHTKYVFWYACGY